MRYWLALAAALALGVVCLAQGSVTVTRRHNLSVGPRHSYSTTFPATENPLSEARNWVGGQSAGGNLWGDIRTTTNFAFGVSEPTTYGDPTAILAGTWGTTQTAQATVHIVSAPVAGNGCCFELEVRLRTAITASTITGYEVYCSVMPYNEYCHIAGWGGANGTWQNLDGCAGVSYTAHLVDGDVLKGTATGTGANCPGGGCDPVVVTLYINGTQHMQVSDNGNIGGSCLYNGDSAVHGPYVDGAPGIGQYDSNDAAYTFSNFGFSAFSATGQ